MNPSSIKKIINKKVTLKGLNDNLPVKICCLPNSVFSPDLQDLLLTRIKIIQYGTQLQ